MDSNFYNYFRKDNLKKNQKSKIIEKLTRNFMMMLAVILAIKRLSQASGFSEYDF